MFWNVEFLIITGVSSTKIEPPKTSSAPPSLNSQFSILSGSSLSTDVIAVLLNYVSREFLTVNLLLCDSTNVDPYELKPFSNRTPSSVILL